MRILVCGGSYWTPRALVFRVLDLVGDEVHVSHVVTPMQYGIDRWITQWGNARGVQVTQVAIPKAERGDRGSGAYRRDDRMFDYGIGAVVAFGRGKGASRVLRRAAADAIPRFVWDDRLEGGTWDGESMQLLERLGLGDQ